MSGEEVIRRATMRRRIDPLFAARTTLARQLVRHDAAEHGRRLTDDELTLIELAAAVALVVADLDPVVLNPQPDPPTYLDLKRTLDPDVVVELRVDPTIRPCCSSVFGHPHNPGCAFEPRPDDRIGYRAVLTGPCIHEGGQRPCQGGCSYTVPPT